MRPFHSKAPVPSIAAVVAVLISGGLAGCADMATDLGLDGKAQATIEADVERVPVVSQSGRSAAVLSVHMRKSFKDACKYGMTLTNNLPFKVTNLTFRMTAMVNGNVPFDTQNKNFYEIRPGEQQYREITFQGVACAEIDRIEVSDPGRCALGDLNRFTAEPGDCAKFSDVAESRLVNMVKKG
jgi:hypothetical protein